MKVKQLKKELIAKRERIKISYSKNKHHHQIKDE